MIDHRRHDKATRATAIDDERLRLMTEERRRNKAVRAKAFDDEWLRLTEEACITVDERSIVTGVTLRCCLNECAKMRQRGRTYWPRRQTYWLRSVDA